MNAREFVNSLFEGYEQTAALADFKEELLANLNAKIENFVKKGMDAEAAFAKASAELGDVSALADELSLKKRKEVFEEVYLDISRYMSPGRVAAYVIFGVIALFGVTVALIASFATREVGLNAGLNFTVFFGALMPFLTTAITGFTYLGVTQETASMLPLSKKRGVWYAVAAGLIAFGLFTMPIVYFSARIASDLLGAMLGFNFETLIPLISLLIPFILPGAGLLTYLILTEKNRLKPWAKQFNPHYSHDFKNKIMESEMAMWSDPATASRFGLFSGAIWIFAGGLFVLLGFLIGFKFSWLVFVFAVAFQLLMMGSMYKNNTPPKNAG